MQLDTLNLKETKGLYLLALFSFIGITIGVATLIIVMSVMNGFRGELLDKIIGVNGHAVIYLKKNKVFSINSLVYNIEELPNVEFVAKEFEFNAMVSNKSLASGVLVKGVEKVDILERDSISKNIIKGNLDNFKNKSIIIGSRLASYLNININDKITLLTSNKTDTPFGSIPITDEYEVISIFDVGMYDYDRGVIFMPIKEASSLVRSDKDITQLEIFLLMTKNLINP